MPESMEQGYNVSLETFLGLLIVVFFGLIVYSNFAKKSIGETLMDLIEFFKGLGGKKK